MSDRLGRTALAFAGSLAVAGCGRIHYDPLGRDGGSDRGLDATLDAGDEGTDSRNDAGSDVLDARADTPDVAADVPIDARDVAVDVRDASTCSVASSPDYCLTLPALPVAPLIDGIPECGIGLHDLTPLRWTGTSPLPAGNSARAAAAWRPDGLYVVVVVTDPTRFPAAPADRSYCGDGVEIYADSDAIYTSPPNYDDPGTSQIIVAAPTNATTPSMRADVYRQGTFRHAAAPTAGAYPTPTGYVVEALVTAADLDIPTWPLSTGPRVGFDLAINVSDGVADAGLCGTRLGQYFFHIDTSGTGTCGLPLPFCDVGAFCRPTLTP